LFHLTQFSSITDSLQQLISEILTFRILHAKEHNSYKLTKECYFSLTRSCCDCVQNQTAVNSITSSMHIGK